MTDTLRYDRVDFQAFKTEEGFLKDNPALTRSGVFPYRNPDGTTRREYRADDVVFEPSSLAAYKGLPITNGHPGLVTSKNAKHAVIGSVLSDGTRHDDHLHAEVVIYNTEAIDEGKKELSVGYKVVIDDTPGISPDGERYDCRQTKIIPNHLAIVSKGRAGTARLNMDAADEAVLNVGGPTMGKENKLEQVRLDNGIAYDAAPEVALELEKLRGEVKTLIKQKDEIEARADAFDEKIKAHEEGAQALKDEAFAQAKARLGLEATAADFEINFDGLSDTEIRAEVVKSLRGDSVSLEDRSDAYIEAAFDLAVADKAERKETVAKSRTQLKEVREDSNASPSAADLRAKHVLGQ